MYTSILENLGNTPVVKLDISDLKNINLYAKLEFYNPTGSVKDRAASYIIKKLLKNNEIDMDTTLIESTSGNFGIALSAFCKKIGLKFCCVIDSNITPINEEIIGKLCNTVIKISKPDVNGGYLLNRIDRVNTLLKEIPNAYWVNQYANKYNFEAYYNSLGKELCLDFRNIDYIFLAVSSGGTIAGVSQRIKEKFPNARVIAVDSVGSVIFGGAAQKRYIPGMGSSMVPDILKYAKIDEVVMVDEVEGMGMCHKILDETAIFAGGSSGSVICAISKYFKGKSFKKKPSVVTVFPDRGDRYANTIYNKEWYDSRIKESFYKNKDFFVGKGG